MTYIILKDTLGAGRDDYPRGYVKTLNREEIKALSYMELK
jgi:hypothetical protein